MKVMTIGIIGAGPSGREIAYAAALGGYRTILEDAMPETLAKTLEWIRQTFDDDVQNGQISPTDRDAALVRIETAACIEAVCRDADFLIEAVPEEMELKLELFTLFDKFAKPNAILASHTSCLSIADMAEMTYRPELCVGMHFVDPVAKSQHIEIVCTPKTSAETIATCCEVGRRMGKRVVVVTESSHPRPSNPADEGRFDRKSGCSVYGCYHAHSDPRPDE